MIAGQKRSQGCQRFLLLLLLFLGPVLQSSRSANLINNLFSGIQALRKGQKDLFQIHKVDSLANAIMNVKMFLSKTLCGKLKQKQKVA